MRLPAGPISNNPSFGVETPRSHTLPEASTASVPILDTGNDRVRIQSVGALLSCGEKAEFWVETSYNPAIETSPAFCATSIAALRLS